MSNQEIKRDYLKFCETNPHDENYVIPTVDLESLLNLIDNQKKYIGFLQSCVRSGEVWEGDFNDFIQRSVKSE